MSQRQIAYVVGSLRRDSINRKLANAVMKLAPDNLAFTELKIDDLPLFNQDNEQTPGPQVKRLKSQIAAADGILFVTPEYNRSVPGVLKNAIDHASRPYGQSSWAGKPAGILSASIGAIGGAMAQQHLRNMLAYLDMPALGQPEAFIQIGEGFFDTSGGIAKESSRKFLQNWIARYANFIDHVIERRHDQAA